MKRGIEMDQFIVYLDEMVETLKDAYIDKMSVISSNWTKVYEKAKENQDVEKIVVEETKFEMLEQIKSKLLELV